MNNDSYSSQQPLNRSTSRHDLRLRPALSLSLSLPPRASTRHSTLDMHSSSSSYLNAIYRHASTASVEATRSKHQAPHRTQFPHTASLVIGMEAQMGAYANQGQQQGRHARTPLSTSSVSNPRTRNTPVGRVASSLRAAGVPPPIAPRMLTRSSRQRPWRRSRGRG